MFSVFGQHSCFHVRANSFSCGLCVWSVPREDPLVSSTGAATLPRACAREKHHVGVAAVLLVCTPKQASPTPAPFAQGKRNVFLGKQSVRSPVTVLIFCSCRYSMNWTRLAPCWPKKSWRMGSPCTMGKEMCISAPTMLLNKTKVGLVCSKLPFQGRCVGVPH